MLLVYIISCVLLGMAFHYLRIAPQTRLMMMQMRSAFGVVGSKTMSDDEKEIALRKQSVEVLLTTTKLTAALIVVFALAYLPIWLGEMAGKITLTGFLYFSIQPWVVIGTVLACVAYAFAAKRFAAER